MKPRNKIVVKLKGLGLSDVDWNKYDFHISPVLTYSKVKRENSNGWCLALEWGHWALWIGIFSIQSVVEKNEC